MAARATGRHVDSSGSASDPALPPCPEGSGSPGLTAALAAAALAAAALALTAAALALAAAALTTTTIALAAVATTLAAALPSR
jgi:hypothetical protein